MFRTLRAKLIFSYAVIAGLSLLLALVVTVALARDKVKSNGFETLQEKKALIMPLVAIVMNEQVAEDQNRPQSPLLRGAALQRFIQSSKVSAGNADLRLLLLDPKTMTVVSDTAQPAELSLVGQQPLNATGQAFRRELMSETGVQGTFTLQDNGVRYQYVAQWLPAQYIRNLLGVKQPNGQTRALAPYVVMLMQPEPGLGSLLNESGRYVLPAMAVALLFSLLVAFLLARSISGPVARLAQASVAMARGEYTQKLPVRGHDELAALTHEFNAMAEEVGRAHRMQKDFIANVSHDLKTPLTSIQGFSQAILDGAVQDEAGYRQAATIINTEAHRMGRMVTEVLKLSRLQGGLVELELRPVELGPVLAQLVLAMQPQAQEAGVDLVAKLGAPGNLVLADVDRLKEAFGNLIDNALKYTPGGGTVSVELRQIEASVQVCIKDTGQGIPPEDLPRVMERFYQVDKARSSHEHRSAGLGLAIVREIVLAHQGQITIESEPGAGTIVKVVLPGQEVKEAGGGRGQRGKRDTHVAAAPHINGNGARHPVGRAPTMPGE